MYLLPINNTNAAVSIASNLSRKKSPLQRKSIAVQKLATPICCSLDSGWCHASNCLDTACHWRCGLPLEAQAFDKSRVEYLGLDIGAGTRIFHFK